jgi:hypothetical protein
LAYSVSGKPRRVDQELNFRAKAALSLSTVSYEKVTPQKTPALRLKGLRRPGKAPEWIAGWLSAARGRLRMASSRRDWHYFRRIWNAQNQRGGKLAGFGGDDSGTGRLLEPRNWRRAAKPGVRNQGPGILILRLNSPPASAADDGARLLEVEFFRPATP